MRFLLISAYLGVQDGSFFALPLEVEDKVIPLDADDFTFILQLTDEEARVSTNIIESDFIRLLEDLEQEKLFLFRKLSCVDDLECWSVGGELLKQVGEVFSVLLAPFILRQVLHVRLNESQCVCHLRHLQNLLVRGVQFSVQNVFLDRRVE